MSNDKWKTVHKKIKPKIQNDKLESFEQDIDNGSNLLFSNKYILWCHDVYSKDWSINGYTKLCSIHSVSEFWRLFNNFNKLDYKHTHFFLMLDGINPIWEDPQNRNGGTCSFKVSIEESIDTFTTMCLYMVVNLLTSKYGDINGISLCPKPGSSNIKIWNKDKYNDLTISLHNDILEKYKSYSIIYKSNEPEY